MSRARLKGHCTPFVSINTTGAVKKSLIHGRNRSNSVKAQGASQLVALHSWCVFCQWENSSAAPGPMWLWFG